MAPEESWHLACLSPPASYWHPQTECLLPSAASAGTSRLKDRLHVMLHCVSCHAQSTWGPGPQMQGLRWEVSRGALRWGVVDGRSQGGALRWGVLDGRSQAGALNGVSQMGGPQQRKARRQHCWCVVHRHCGVQHFCGKGLEQDINQTRKECSPSFYMFIDIIILCYHKLPKERELLSFLHADGSAVDDPMCCWWFLSAEGALRGMGINETFLCGYRSISPGQT